MKCVRGLSTICTWSVRVHVRHRCRSCQQIAVTCLSLVVLNSIRVVQKWNCKSSVKDIFVKLFTDKPSIIWVFRWSPGFTSIFWRTQLYLKFSSLTSQSVIVLNFLNVSRVAGQISLPMGTSLPENCHFKSLFAQYKHGVIISFAPADCNSSSGWTLLAHFTFTISSRYDIKSQLTLAVKL